MLDARAVVAISSIAIKLAQTVEAWSSQPQRAFPKSFRAHVPGVIIDANGLRRPRFEHTGLSVVSSAEGGGGGGGTVNEEWREFRAHLVRSEHGDEDDATKDLPNSPRKRRDDGEDDNHWAYETGDFVERGSVVVAVPSSSDFLNDVDTLNNVCYRKSIVLVLDVGPSFIQGIVLNRPTNIGVKEGMQFVQPGHGEVFENEMGSCLGENCEIGEYEAAPASNSARWKVWFGGEVGGPYSDYPQVMCLHSVSTDFAKNLSDLVLPGIYVSPFDGAQSIVQAGDANPSDFWLFCGICGWETSGFYREMHEEGLWHIVSVDGGTILEELNMQRCDELEELAVAENCDIDHDPRNAGLHTWEMLMEKIGLGKEAHESDDSFGDLMLREWATGALSFSVKDEQSTSMIMDPLSDPRFDDDDNDFDLAEYDPASAMSAGGISEQTSPGLVGVMVRSSSATRSPYLLSDQGFHKSILLILRDSDDCSEGILLNHVTSRTLRLDVGDDHVVDIPIRFGGPALYFETEGEEDNYDDSLQNTPTIFLHSSDHMRDAGIGIPVGKSRLFRCTREEVTKGLRMGLASVSEIMAVQGFSVWTKKGEHTGVLGDVESEFFELVPRPKVPHVWQALLLQELLTEESLAKNISKGRLAWLAASRDADEVCYKSKKGQTHVFASDVDVSMLADEAASRWVRVNLL